MASSKFIYTASKHLSTNRTNKKELETSTDRLSTSILLSISTSPIDLFAQPSYDLFITNYGILLTILNCCIDAYSTTVKPIVALHQTKQFTLHIQIKIISQYRGGGFKMHLQLRLSRDARCGEKFRKSYISNRIYRSKIQINSLSLRSVLYHLISYGS